MDIGKALIEEFEVIKKRQEKPQEGSYTSYLFEKGEDKILKKIGEEASEIIIASKNSDNDETAYEITDLLFHIGVLLALKGMSWDDVACEIIKKRKKENMQKEKEEIRKAENRTEKRKDN